MNGTVPACILSLATFGLVGAATADVRLPPGKALDRGTVERLLVEALADGGEDADFALTVEHPDLPLANRASQPITLSVVGFERDGATGRYAAQLSATLPDGTAGTIELEGSVARLVEVPVLSRAVAAGEVIGPADVAWRKVPEPRGQSDALLEIGAIVGLEARRPLPADRMLRARDVKPLLAVRRGEAVSVVFSSGKLEITALGVAMGSGGLGEAVQVRNTDSGVVRSGVVEAPRRVRVNGSGAPR